MALSSVTDGTGYKKDDRGLGIEADMHAIAADGRDAARHAVDAAKIAVKDQYEGIRDSAENAAASLKDVIVHNPMASLGIAAAAGLLVGLVFTRRS
jgi:ElaB/YqjD/DUF883 family membrane-anchored ribosome-binding protein